MHRLSIAILFLTSLFVQAGGNPVDIPVPVQTFDLGYGSSISETLGVSPAELQAIPGRPGYFFEGVYSLTVTLQNDLGNYPGYVTAKISFGTQELCESSVWGKRAAKTITFVCPGPGYIVADKALPGGGPVQGSANLALNFSVNVWSVSGSGIVLTFTPE